MLNRLAVDLTEEEHQVFMDAMKVTGHAHKTAFVRFLIKRIAGDIAAELDSKRLCYKRGDEVELIARLTPEIDDGDTT